MREIRITGKRLKLFVLAAISVLVISFFYPIFIGNNPDTIKYVKANEADTIRVGFCRVEGFISYDELGNHEGYYVDYLERIAQITGWNYEFIELESMEQGKEKLLAHEIDLLAPCRINSALFEEFEYSQYSFGTEYLVLATRPDSSICYEDYEGMEGARIGLINNSLMRENLYGYMESNNFAAEFVYFDTPDELEDALNGKEVDLILMNQMMVDDEKKIAARFSPYAYYFITWKGNDAFLEDLNNAMQNLKNTYPGLENELLETYFPLYNILYFTRQEQEFIDSLDTIKVAYIDENTPISYKNGEGEIDGISKEIFDKIQEISGLKFEYEVLPKGDITYDYLRERGFDLITGVRYNRSNLYSRGILLSNPYLSSKLVLVGDSGAEFNIDKAYTVAILSGSQTLKSEILSNYPDFNIISCASVKECFESVKEGRADLLMTDRYIANYWLSKPRYSKLYTVPADELKDELCFSAVVDIYGTNTLNGVDGVELISIINKTLSRISDEEIEEIIINENNENRYKYNFEDFVYLYRYEFIIGALGLFIAAALYVYSRYLKGKAMKIQKAESQRIAIQNKRYQMMMDSSGEMLYDVNITGDKGFISGQIKEKFGWDMPERVTDFTKDEMGKLFHIHPDDWNGECANRIKRSLDKNLPSDCLVRIMAKDKSEVWCKIYFFPLLNDENRLVSIIGKIEDVDNDIKEMDKLKHESQTDGMTGLMNKRTFEEKATSQLVERTAYNSAVIFVDLDHFKNLNDTLGHSVGDDAIKEAAAKLQLLFANVDLVSRFGGDEFCVFVWDIPKVKLKDKLERIVKIIQKTYSVDNLSVNITASVGAVYCTMRESTFKTLLNLADIALYEAKDNGRNQYVLKEL